MKKSLKIQTSLYRMSVVTKEGGNFRVFIYLQKETLLISTVGQ